MTLQLVNFFSVMWLAADLDIYVVLYFGLRAAMGGEWSFGNSLILFLRLPNVWRMLKNQKVFFVIMLESTPLLFVLLLTMGRFFIKEAQNNNNKKLDLIQGFEPDSVTFLLKKVHS
ncbi:hypothetical protein ACJX0J_019711 [Zea mays]